MDISIALLKIYTHWLLATTKHTYLQWDQIKIRSQPCIVLIIHGKVYSALDLISSVYLISSVNIDVYPKLDQGTCPSSDVTSLIEIMLLKHATNAQFLLAWGQKHAIVMGHLPHQKNCRTCTIIGFLRARMQVFSIFPDFRNFFSRNYLISGNFDHSDSHPWMWLACKNL